MLAIGGVDDSDSAAAKPDVNLFRGFIVTHIVSIIFEIEFTDLLERFAVIDFADTSIVICNEDAVQLRDVGDSLRRAKVGNRMDSFALEQVEHLDGVVAERTNEQSFAGGIKREMVYSSFDSRQRDRLL